VPYPTRGRAFEQRLQGRSLQGGKPLGPGAAPAASGSGKQVAQLLAGPGRIRSARGAPSRQQPRPGPRPHSAWPQAVVNGHQTWRCHGARWGRACHRQPQQFETHGSKFTACETQDSWGRYLPPICQQSRRPAELGGSAPSVASFGVVPTVVGPANQRLVEGGGGGGGRAPRPPASGDHVAPGPSTTAGKHGTCWRLVAAGHGNWRFRCSLHQPGHRPERLAPAALPPSPLGFHRRCKGRTPQPSRQPRQQEPGKSGSLAGIGREGGARETHRSRIGQGASIPSLARPGCGQASGQPGPPRSWPSARREQGHQLQGQPAASGAAAVQQGLPAGLRSQARALSHMAAGMAREALGRPRLLQAPFAPLAIFTCSCERWRCSCGWGRPGRLPWCS